MIRLNKIEGIWIDGNYYDNGEIIEVARLQEALFKKRNIICSFEECIKIWHGYSSDLCASWLIMPEDLESIVRYIELNDMFISFENYLL